MKVLIWECSAIQTSIIIKTQDTHTYIHTKLRFEPHTNIGMYTYSYTLILFFNPITLSSIWLHHHWTRQKDDITHIKKEVDSDLFNLWKLQNNHNIVLRVPNSVQILWYYIGKIVFENIKWEIILIHVFLFFR